MARLTSYGGWAWLWGLFAAVMHLPIKEAPVERGTAPA